MIYDHLLEEVGELIFAMEREEWRRAFDVMVATIQERMKRSDKDRHPTSELADVTNLPVFVYICGRKQGAKELERWMM